MKTKGETVPRPFKLAESGCLLASSIENEKGPLSGFHAYAAGKVSGDPELRAPMEAMDAAPGQPGGSQAVNNQRRPSPLSLRPPSKTSKYLSLCL